MILNHVSNKITKGHLDLMLRFFTEELGFILLRRIPTDIWLRQGDANVDIQICESFAIPMTEDKHNSHIAFLSDTPKEDLEKLAAWFESHGKKPRVGSWSEREYWLDVPEVFVDFVIEAMTPDLAEYDV